MNVKNNLALVDPISLLQRHRVSVSKFAVNIDSQLIKRTNSSVYNLKSEEEPKPFDQRSGDLPIQINGVYSKYRRVNCTKKTLSVFLNEDNFWISNGKIFDKLENVKVSLLKNSSTYFSFIIENHDHQNSETVIKPLFTSLYTSHWYDEVEKSGCCTLVKILSDPVRTNKLLTRLKDGRFNMSQIIMESVNS